jgi:hypothetical protein
MYAVPSVRGRVDVAGLVALAVAGCAMAIDHLVGTDRGEGDEGFPVDPAMFAISVALSVAVFALLFAWVVPRARAAGPERTARVGLVLSALSVIPGIALLWVGIPFVLAGAGVSLGSEGRAGGRRVEAIAAVVLGAVVQIAGLVAYLLAAIV